jgi:hypothetical protein
MKLDFHPVRGEIMKVSQITEVLTSINEYLPNLRVKIPENAFISRPVNCVTKLGNVLYFRSIPNIQHNWNKDKFMSMELEPDEILIWSLPENNSKGLPSVKDGWKVKLDELGE